MHKYCTSVVKLLLSHNIHYMRGTYLLSPPVYFGICDKMPATVVTTVWNCMPHTIFLFMINGVTNLFP